MCKVGVSSFTRDTLQPSLVNDIRIEWICFEMVPTYVQGKIMVRWNDKMPLF